MAPDRYEWSFRKVGATCLLSLKPSAQAKEAIPREETVWMLVWQKQKLESRSRAIIVNQEP